MFLSPVFLMISHRYKFCHTNRNIMLLHCINNYSFPRIKERFSSFTQNLGWTLLKSFMNSSSICISVLFSSHSYENAHKFYMFTSLLLHWCINWAIGMVDCSRLSLMSVEASGVSGILQHIVQLSSVQCAEIHCVTLANFRQINPNELELFQFTQTDKLLCTLLLWKMGFASNVYEIVEINFRPKCQIC